MIEKESSSQTVKNKQFEALLKIFIEFLNDHHVQEFIVQAMDKEERYKINQPQVCPNPSLSLKSPYTSCIGIALVIFCHIIIYFVTKLVQFWVEEDEKKRK